MSIKTRIRNIVDALLLPFRLIAFVMNPGAAEDRANARHLKSRKNKNS